MPVTFAFRNLSARHNCLWRRGAEAESSGRWAWMWYLLIVLCQASPSRIDPAGGQRLGPLAHGGRLWLVVACAFALLAACTKVPAGRTAIDTVEVQGAQALNEDAIIDNLATTPSPQFLGLFPGVVYEYEVYDESVLQRDLARVERHYRSNGFFDAHVRVARVKRTRDAHVRVEIVVDEGPPTLNAKVAVRGLETVPAAIAIEVRRAAQRALPAGRRFDEATYQTAAQDTRHALLQRGYAYAEVEPSAEVDVARHTVNYLFTVRSGPPTTLGQITFEGLDPDAGGPRQNELSESKLRQALDIQEGDAYSSDAIAAAEVALRDLNVFSAVSIEPKLVTPAPTTPAVVPLVAHVEPVRLRQVRLGGGAEFDQLKTDVHALAGWEDRNFLGGLRDFSIKFKPGVVLHPTRINNWVAPDRLLPEERLQLQLRQPGFLEARTQGYLRADLNVFPLLVDPNATADDPIVGFREVKWTAGAERRIWKLLANLGYSVQIESPFTYRGTLDPSLSTLVLLYPQLITTLDFRDDPVHPHSGAYVSNNLQLAGWAGGGSARDVRVQPEARVYVPVTRWTTLATRASVGFLFPSDYGDVIQYHLHDQLTDANRTALVRDIETIYWRGFFSGGPSSNRGFPLRWIAPHGVVPFLNPATASQQIALNCNPNSPSLNTEACSIPIGGLTLWEFSSELRYRIAGAFTSSLFCDMGDVSRHRAELRFKYLHLSCGAGARYDTPVGPIRLDVGYRVQPLQVLGFRNEQAVWQHDHVEGLPPTIFGIPMAISVGIGEAY